MISTPPNLAPGTSAGRAQDPDQAAWTVPGELEAAIDALIARYPQKRSASLMVLHALQESLGFIPKEAIEWTARKLSVQPIQVYELVTFYPMFRQTPAGKVQFKICRTLSCALGGADALHARVCWKLGLDPARRGLQITSDGGFSVEFVECLASCGTAPVMMCNDDFHEGVTPEQSEAILERCIHGTANPKSQAQIGNPKSKIQNPESLAAEHGFEP